jgi:hypothetical protein
MKTATAKREGHKFTALIRWHGPDPAVELETQFPGFDSPRKAALFAASALSTSPHGLRLSADRIDLVHGQGDSVNFPYDTITVWIMTPPETTSDPRDPANPSKFQMHSHSALAAYRTAHGLYKRAWYAVLGPGGIPVRVAIEAGDLTLTIPELH